MRIPMRRTYRAFPELDRFTDGQCERFVSAAGRRARGRYLHGAVLVVLSVSATLGSLRVSIGLMDQLSARLHLGDAAFRFVLAIVLGLAFLLPALVVLIVRDRLLLQRIRYILEERAVCRSCRYSLLGMLVGDDNMVVCPECGTRVRADPSLNELVRDDEGRTVYRPSERL